MNGEIKKYIYIIAIIFIVFLSGSIIVRILPYFLLFAIVAYGVMKIVGFVRGKKEQKAQSNFDFNNRDNNVDSYKESSEEYTNGEIIDVDYEEVDKK